MRPVPKFHTSLHVWLISNPLNWDIKRDFVLFHAVTIIFGRKGCSW